MDDTQPPRLARARARAAEAPPAPLSPPAVEGLRRAARRALGAQGVVVAKAAAEGAVRSETRQRLDEAAARLAALYEAAWGDPASPELAPPLEALRRGLEAAGRALERALSEEGSRAVEEARTAEAILREVPPVADQAERPLRLVEQESQVYDPETGRSKYDPEDEAVLVFPVRCPRETCAAAHEARLLAAWSTHRVACPACGVPYTLYAGVVARVERRPRPGAVEVELEARDPDGTGRTLRFDTPLVGERPPLFPGGLVVVTYDADNRIRRVQGSTPEGDLWLPGASRCFVATAALGPFAPELAVLRRWRDQRLRPHPVGRRAVAIYEAVGPGLAALVSRSPTLQRAVRGVARRVAARVDRATPPLDPQSPRG